jgi:hypothetical protein
MKLISCAHLLSAYAKHRLIQMPSTLSRPALSSTLSISTQCRLVREQAQV